MMSKTQTGVLVVNLGTPASPTTRSVRLYLKEFLSDPLVLTMPAAARWLLLHAVILPFRSPRSAKAYQKVWREEGSPLLLHSRQFVNKLASSLGEDYHVELVMRYGEPAIRNGLKALQDCQKIVVLPMYPQFARATTQSTIDKVEDEARSLLLTDKLIWLRDFYNDPGYVEANIEHIRRALAHSPSDFLLMSYHGLPAHHLPSYCQSQDCCRLAEPCAMSVAAIGDCYRAQCYATSRLLAEGLGMCQQDYQVSFQSRLGAARWVQPYTDAVLKPLHQRGIRKLAVVCPSFVVDCLETLEEVAIRLQERWLTLGGEQLTVIPCLNANEAWVNVVSQWVRNCVNYTEETVE